MIHPIQFILHHLQQPVHQFLSVTCIISDPCSAIQDHFRRITRSIFPDSIPQIHSGIVHPALFALRAAQKLPCSVLMHPVFTLRTHMRIDPDAPVFPLQFRRHDIFHVLCRIGRGKKPLFFFTASRNIGSYRERFRSCSQFPHSEQTYSTIRASTAAPGLLSNTSFHSRPYFPFRIFFTTS